MMRGIVAGGLGIRTDRVWTAGRGGKGRGGDERERVPRSKDSLVRTRRISHR